MRICGTIMLALASALPLFATDWIVQDGPARPLNYSGSGPVSIDLEVDPDGRHHVILLEMPNSGDDVLSYYVQRGGDFEIAAAPPEFQEISQAELLIDRSGRPQVFMVADKGEGRRLFHFQIQPDGNPTTPVDLGASTFASIDSALLPDGRLGVIHNISSSRIRLLVLEGGQDPVIREFPRYLDWLGTRDSSLAFDANGFAHVAAVAFDFDSETGIRQSALLYQTISTDPEDPVGAWQMLITNAVVGNLYVAGEIDIAIQPNGLPFIGFHDQIQQLARAARRTISGWEFDDITALTNMARIDAGINQSGRLSLAWESSGPGALLTNYRGSSWSSPETLPLDIRAVLEHGPSGYVHAFGDEEGVSDGLVSIRPRDVSDLDGDGASYLVETAFRSNPDLAASRPDIDFTIPSNNRPSLSFAGLSDLTEVDSATLRSTAEGIFYLIQLSDDLDSWTTDPTALDTDVFSISGRKVVASSQTGTVGGTARPFMRIKVLRDP